MPNRDRNPPKGSTILLKVSEEKVVTNFLARTGKGNGFIVVDLNHVYNNKKIVSDICTSWDKTSSFGRK